MSEAVRILDGIMADIDVPPTPRSEQKLVRLQSLMLDAIKQIRKKLNGVYQSIEQLQSVEMLTGETKLVCTLLIEITELLKHYPAIKGDEQHTISEEDQNSEDKFVKFKISVYKMIDDIAARLNAVANFIESTESLPKAMTVAVTVRDVTKHLKVISGNTGKLLNIPAVASASTPRVDGSVGSIVQYYSELEKPAPPTGRARASKLGSASLTSKDVISKLARQPSAVETKLETVERMRSTSKLPVITSEIKMSKQEQERMEVAVENRFQSISKTRGEFLATMLNDSTSINHLFDPVDQDSSNAKKPISMHLDNSKVYMCGKLKKRYTGFGKTWKTHHWVLDCDKLTCYHTPNSQIPLKVYPLSEFKRCSWHRRLNELKDELHTITLIGKSDRKITLQADTDKDMINWVCALDTVQIYIKKGDSILNPLDKHYLLQLAFKKGFKGGAVKSSYDEEWSYSADGVLSASDGVGLELSYRWDGEMLIGLNNESRTLGSGKWNGISLIWYDEQSNGMITTPVVRYDWSQADQEYHNTVEESQIWKWTRHFLASKFGAGEWIVEGEIPQPVVMFLQMMRTCRIRRTVGV